MTSREKSKLPAPINVDIIDLAPIKVEKKDFTEEESKKYSDIIADLQVKLQTAEAEKDRIKGERLFESALAELMGPFSRNVFKFVVGYCLIVGFIIMLAGFGKTTGFALSDAILGIIAGSTAVSVIGLIGLVVSGLFPRKAKD